MRMLWEMKFDLVKGDPEDPGHIVEHVSKDWAVSEFYAKFEEQAEVEEDGWGEEEDDGWLGSR